MRPLTLTLRAAPRQDIDVSALTPQRLAGLERAALGALRLPGGLPVGELFEIAEGDAQQLVLRGATARLTHVGAGMRAGTLRVEGDCGAFAGQGMRGGKLIVTGNAGDFLGGAPAGARQGMRGGLIAVHGNAGERVGERMRRGLIVIGGDAGAGCAANMLAGTIFVAGSVGPLAGFALKRGTLLLAQPPRSIPPTFQDSGEHCLLFLTLLDRQLQAEAPALGNLPPLPGRVRRYCGDLACGGTGEMLVFA